MRRRRAATKRLGVETTGIEIIDESERTARPRDLFWPWFAANVSVFGISYAAFVLGFGISFWQAVLVTVVGIVVSFLLCGIIAIAGKRGSAPTMILSRAAFGVNGQKVPGVISWLVSIGWETFLAILAVLATATIFEQLGWGGGTGTKIVARRSWSPRSIVLASVAGYHIIMRMQSVLTWVTGIVTDRLRRRDASTTSTGPRCRSSRRAGPGGGRRVRPGDDRLRPRLDQHRRRLVALPAPRRPRCGHRLLEHLRRCDRPGAPRRLRPAAVGLDQEVLDGIAADPIGTLATLLPDVVPRAVPRRGDPVPDLAAPCSASTPRA